jgi:hypothetical protein
MFRKDYTAMPPGKKTRQGVITLCALCGQAGAYWQFTVQDRTLERWVHEQWGWTLSQVRSCSRQIAGPPPGPPPGF